MIVSFGTSAKCIDYAGVSLFSSVRTFTVFPCLSSAVIDLASQQSKYPLFQNVKTTLVFYISNIFLQICEIQILVC